MHSSTEQHPPSQTQLSRQWSPGWKLWNRKLHSYLGLSLLFFVWLFAFTGLLLNHPQWRFAEFWEHRQQTTYERDIEPPAAASDLALARKLMPQLGLRGEIEWTRTRSDASRLDFRVSRPGHIYEIKTDLTRKKAAIQRIELNSWGVIRILHTFTGVRLEDARNGRDWILTTVWAMAMDAVAVGLTLMVLGSLYMWYELRPKRRWGGLVLSLGCLSCGLFCLGLRWLY